MAEKALDQFLRDVEPGQEQAAEEKRQQYGISFREALSQFSPGMAKSLHNGLSKITFRATAEELNHDISRYGGKPKAASRR